jgi:hypothetical protein
MSEEKYSTLKAWFNHNLSEYAEDLAIHGAVAGFPGITSYYDTGRLYDQYHDEIWEMLYEDYPSYGYSHILELLATFNGADVTNDAQFKNLLVWHACETYARDYEAEAEEEEDEKEAKEEVEEDLLTKHLRLARNAKHN